MRIAFAILTTIFLCSTALAEPAADKCFGVLHSKNGGIMFGGAKGEGEGICVIGKTEVSKVLAVCVVGSKCTVEGLIDYCEDSGECSEVKQVTSVRKR